jgi:hypothetical protein
VIPQRFLIIWNSFLSSVLVVCVTQIEHYVGQSRVGVYACAEPLGSAPPCQTGSGGPWRARAGEDAHPTPSQRNVYQLGSTTLAIICVLQAILEAQAKKTKARDHFA